MIQVSYLQRRAACKLSAVANLGSYKRDIWRGQLSCISDGFAVAAFAACRNADIFPGIVITEALQMSDGDSYLQAASVTRHWYTPRISQCTIYVSTVAHHSHLRSAYSGPEGFDDNARFAFDANMTAFDLEDAMFPVFEAIHTATAPEGMMCR